MKDDKILELLSNSREKVESVEKTIRFLNSDNGDMNRMMNEMDGSIKEMKNKLTVEEVFVAKYIKTWKPFRIFMFYQVK
jgi:hypothetical protein